MTPIRLYGNVRMMADPPVLIIGASAANHLLLRPTRRTYPDLPDYWDGNWLKVDVAVRTGAFHGEFETELRADEFVAFRDQLRAVHESLRGEAALKTLEGCVSVQIVIDRLGHLDARCEVREALARADGIDDPEAGCELRFALRFDQTYLPTMLDALDAIVRVFPVVGRPDE